MNKQRAAAEAEILLWMEKIHPGGGMVEKYKTLLKELSDEEFHNYMTQLADGTAVLSIEVPNLETSKITIENNLKLAKELGHEFFERLWLTDPATDTVYLTPHRYLVIDLPLRRQQQMLVEKSSIPESNRHVDDLTGQPSGESHAASLTFPELQVLYARGADALIEEYIKFRGGDTKAFQRMNRQAQATGGVSLEAIKQQGPTRVKSTETLGTLLTAAHLSNNV